MINLLDCNEDGNFICPKCHSDNVEIYKQYLEISGKNQGHISLVSQHYVCLDCKNSSFLVDKSRKFCSICGTKIIN